MSQIIILIGVILLAGGARAIRRPYASDSRALEKHFFTAYKNASLTWRVDDNEDWKTPTKLHIAACLLLYTFVNTREYPADKKAKHTCASGIHPIGPAKNPIPIIFLSHPRLLSQPELQTNLVCCICETVEESDTADKQPVVDFTHNFHAAKMKHVNHFFRIEPVNATNPNQYQVVDYVEDDTNTIQLYQQTITLEDNLLSSERLD